MSHFTTIQTPIRGAAALADACAKRGVERLRETEARGFANGTRLSSVTRSAPPA